MQLTAHHLTGLLLLVAANPAADGESSSGLSAGAAVLESTDRAGPPAILPVQFHRVDTPPADVSREPALGADETVKRSRHTIPLSPPGHRIKENPQPAVPPTPARSILTILSSLAIVLGLFFVVVWLSRRGVVRAAGLLPKQVVENLGRAPLAGRQQMQLLRVGNKLVLVSVTPTGAETLTEVTDPDEVQRLCGLCEAQRPGSSSTSFHEVFAQFGGKKSLSGSWDGRAADGSEPA